LFTALRKDNPKVWEKALDLLEIEYPDDFVPFKKLIDAWLNMDSSIPA